MLTILPTTNHNTNFKEAPDYKKLTGQITALTNEEKIIPKTKLPNKFVIKTADCKKKIIALKKQLRAEIKNKIKNFHFNVPLIFMSVFASLGILFCMGMYKICTEIEQKGKEIAKIIELVQRVQSLIPNENKKRIICSDDTVYDFYLNGKHIKSNLIK